ncbi:site-2 protease family protein [Geminocystis sp. GBBB08]|uniref:site-2 protease family protein n=1 Tax=Geminocystis sp. GBBB08 TaxID=2604140 RepID=UPI0027E2E4BD|nr:site-2 protease family protein [Geminocystis sp. GBBB08]MBL1208636.1 site-2 protease family protein [Geminocystis sp. GBBB08]
MELIILFLFLSTISYMVIKQNISKITTTPIWLLWLSLMIPPLIWAGWYILNPSQNSMPSFLVLIPLLISPILYIWLIQRGKIPPTESKDKSSLEKLEKTLKESESTQEEKTKPPNPINAQEEKALRDCFPWGVYYLQKIDYLPQGILCMGKLMTAPEKAYPIVKGNLEKVFQDRFLIIFQETLQGQPFFALVPNPYSDTLPQKLPQEKLIRPGMALFLLLLTLLTTTIIGAEISGVQVSELETNPFLILQGLPYSLCLIAILGVHELSHYLFAIYYQIRTTLPYFIPLPFFLGTFGAFISIKSPMPHRQAVFDVAIAGPVGGFLVTIPVLVWGLAYSEIVPMPEKMNILNFTALDPRFSLLFSIISKIVLGSKLVADQAISLHPAAVAGYIGLIITALNLMPVGQLDGGHMVHAMFGQGKALIIGQITRLLVIILALVRTEFLLWAIILIFMPVTDQPALNDVTELDNTRDILGLLALVLLIAILLPLPPTVAQWLSLY